jgi:hypothetical protein
VRSGEGDLSCLVLGAEACFVVGLHVKDDRARRLRLHPVRIAQHEEDAKRQSGEQDHDPPHESVADRDASDPRCDSRRERVDRRAEHADPASDQHNGGARERVVAGRNQNRDHERVERQALFRHAVRGAAEGEDAHQRRDQQALPARHPADEAADAGLNRAGLHRHAEKAADHEDEQRDVDRAEERPRVVVVDVPALVLDPVEAVDRRCQRVDEDAGRLRVNLVVGARERLTRIVCLVGASRDDPRRDRRDDDQREQDRVRRRQREPALALWLDVGDVFAHLGLLTRPRVRSRPRRA